MSKYSQTVCSYVSHIFLVLYLQDAILFSLLQDGAGFTTTTTFFWMKKLEWSCTLLSSYLILNKNLNTGLYDFRDCSCHCFLCMKLSSNMPYLSPSNGEIWVTMNCVTFLRLEGKNFGIQIFLVADKYWLSFCFQLSNYTMLNLYPQWQLCNSGTR
jgi:hypothetical protein